MADNKLILEIGARLDSAFTSAFSSAQSKIRALGQELAELKRKQELIKKFELQTQQVETAKQRLEEARQKVEELRQAAANDPTGGMAKKLEAAEQKAEKLAQSLDKTEKALGHTKERMQEAGLSSENTAQQLEQLAKQADKTEKAIERKKRQMELSATATERMGALYSGVKVGLGVAAAAMSGMGLAVADSTNELLAMHKALEVAEKQLGISSQALHVWGLGAAKVGLDGEKIRDIFKDVSDKLGDLATTGGGEAVDVVKRLGLNINDLINMQPDQALLKIGKAMTDVKNISQHDKIFLLESIADDASALLPLLENNGQLLRELEATAQKRGTIITPAEERILDEANAKLDDMKSAMSGLSQETGLMGSELVSAFGPSLTAALDNVTQWVRDELRVDMRQLLTVWEDSASGMLGQSALFAQGSGIYFKEVYETARYIFTYLPVIANAAYTAIHAYGESWGHSTAAVFYVVKGAAAHGFAAVVELGGRAFGELVGIAGKAVGNIIGLFADMAGGASKLGNIPGFEAMGASIGGIEQNLRGLAASASSAGSVVTQGFVAQADSIRASANESLQSAYAHQAAAAGAKMAAAAAIDNTKAYIDRKETQRAVIKEMESEVEKTSALKSVLDQAKDTNQKYTATAKDKEGADKQAKGAADEHAKAAKDLANEINKNQEELQKTREEVALLTIHHQQGKEAMLQKKFTVTGLTAAEVAERVALEQTKETLTDLIQKREQATQTVQTAKDELRLATIERDQGKDAMLREQYTLDGLTATQAAERASLEQSKTKIEDEIKAREKAAETLKTAKDELRLVTVERDQGKDAMLREKYELEGLSKAQAAERASLELSKTKIEEEIKKREKATETLKTAKDELRLATLERDKGKDAMLREKYELEGLSKAQAAERASLELSKTKIEEEIKKREKATETLKTAKDELHLATLERDKGKDAMLKEKYILEGLNDAQADERVSLEKTKTKIEELSKSRSELNQNLGKHLTDSIMSAVETGKISFKTLADAVKSEFANMVLRPVIQAVMKPVGDLLGGIMGKVGDSLATSLGLGKVLGTAGAAGTASATGGLGGLLGGSAGGLGGLISSIPGWGWALAGVAGLAKLFGGPSDPKLRFTQGATAGQQMLGQGGHAGNAHHYQTAFGTIGATAASDKIGREKDFVPKFHAMMQQMQALDQMIADTMPHHVAKFTSALKGLETSGFSTGDMLKQRYQTVFSALPEELQKAMASGRDVTKLTAEEIIAEFGKLSEVAKSGLVTSLQSLGLNLGSTKDSALAAAMGLTNLMGGIDKVKAANDFFYQEFFTEEERKQAALKQANTAVLEWNKSLGLSGSSVIKSHEAFKKYVLGLDLSTEAGRKAYAEAMKVAGSLDAVADAAKAAKDAAKAERDAKIAHIAEVKRSLPALGAYGLNLGDTRLGAIQAANGLAALMGGMDQLKSAAQIYYNEFFSDKEKEQLTLANAAAKVALLNQQLGLTGEAALDTNAEVRKYLESLDPTKAADQEKYAAIMKVIGALDMVGDSGKSLDKIMSELPPEMLKQALMQAKLADEADKSNKKNSDSLDSATKKMADLGTEAGKLAKPIGLASDNAVTATTNIGAMKTAVGGLATALTKAAGEINAAATKAATTTTTTTTTTTSKNDGSHALGLRNVPFDGYRAILHKDEAVIPARDAAILRMGLPVQMDAQTNILALSAANDEQPTNLPAGVTPLPQRVTQVLQRVERAAGTVEVNVPSNTAPINITINTAPGQDATQIAAEVERVLKRMQQQQARQLRAQHRDGVA